MASCSTPQWSGDYTPQVKLTVTQQSSNDTQVVLAWTLEYVTHGYTANTNGDGRSYSVTIDGDSVRTGTFDIDGKSSTTIASGTKTVNKTTSSRNVSFSCSFNFDITWSDVYGGTKTASSSISIGAKTSYTVSFDANGGSGAPSSQTKWHGTTLTLSSTKPTRSGYTFVGWGTSASDTSKDYDAGGNYTANAADTLYAIWKKTIKLTYNANNGSGAPSAQEQTIYNATTSYKFTISSTKPTRTGYTFLGWSTSSTATSSSYAAGGSITLSDSDTLYAVWKVNSYTYNIVYKSSSGTQLGTATVSKDYGTTNTVSPKSFTGYTSPSSQSIKWDSTSAKTITFTYTPISYNVTINCNGGSGVNSRAYTIETATFTLSTPTKTGYTFKGWTGSNGSTAQKTVSIAKGSTGDKSYTAQWDENVLTVHYYSNYATSAFDGALNTVGADKNVEVYTSSIYYDNDYSTYGLANYSTSGGSAYLSRIGYTPTGYWGTTTSGGILIDEDDKSFTTGQSLAKALGKDLSSESASINIYAQWTENKLTVNYYSNKADYGTLKGDPLNVNEDTNVLVDSQDFLYDNKYDNGLSDIQNKNYLYLSRTGYNSTGYWGTIDGKMVYEKTPFTTGQDLAVALGKSIANGDVSVNIYPQWTPSGVVYIDNGIKLEPYLPYIDNGTSWDLYLVYVDNGTDWDIIS
jgi:uncharacterized repeat protein (TIGR02543 family)